jgi:LacI family transcriptional regulator
MPVTIKDVARAAGVSITTVSRALNGHSDVSPETRRAVLKVAEELNYRPSAIARSLVMQKTRTIGVLVSDLTKDRGGHHFMFDVLRGLHDRVTELGYDVILMSTSTTRQRLTSYLDFCRERRLDGVVVMGIRLDDPYVHEVVESTLPSVVIDLPLISQHCGYVMTDNVNGARFAVRHLVQKGHRRIAMVNGHRMAAVSQDRLRGYKEALAQEGVPFDEQLVIEGDFTQKSGEAAMDIIHTQHPDVTAVFFASDLMAVGGLLYAREKGLDVPKDIAIIGFDNIDLTEFVMPPLSTIGQRRFEMGVSAAEMLIGMLENGQAPEGRMLAPELIVRQST